MRPQSHLGHVDRSTGRVIPVEALLRWRDPERGLISPGVFLRVAIDDFGMAHSSPTRLAEFPVDSLKNDRSFISQLGHQPHSQGVVSTIIGDAYPNASVWFD